MALPVEMQSLVGSQSVPYIYEDYCSAQTTAEAILKLYEMGHEGRRELGKKARQYVMSEFSLEKTVHEWDRTLTDLVDGWQESKSSKSWEVREL